MSMLKTSKKSGPDSWPHLSLIYPYISLSISSYMLVIHKISQVLKSYRLFHGRCSLKHIEQGHASQLMCFNVHIYQMNFGVYNLYDDNEPIRNFTDKILDISRTKNTLYFQLSMI